MVMTDPVNQDRHPRTPGEIIRSLVGSTLHGTGLPGAEDRDEMGVCIEPSDAIFGLKRFDQYIYRTQPEGVRSGPGDLDLTVYGLKKFMRLVTQGNPTVLLLLFTPKQHLVFSSGIGGELQGLAPFIVSKQAAPRFLGYAKAQRERLLGTRGHGHGRRGGGGREELIGEHGYDTKFAMHMVRLGYQGVELLQTGRIALPMEGIARENCIAIRKGELSKEDAIAISEYLETQIQWWWKNGHLREDPNYDVIHRWMKDVYMSNYSTIGEH